MNRLTVLTALLLAALLAAPPLSVADDDVAAEDVEKLAEQVDVLAAEVRRLKEQMVIPETDKELVSSYGLGPAASKVYRRTSGLSLGGYGEFHFAAPTGGKDSPRVADFLRFVTYIGYKFNSRIVMNTELEYEHGTTSSNWQGKSGSVSVEFSYLDFLLYEQFNIRTGNVLVPMGFLNQIHEPPFYHGNVRPVTETQIIPTTWRELGIGAHGEIASGLTYNAYVINGFNGKKFGESGVRGGRQKGNRVLWEDVGGILGIDWKPNAKLWLGASGFWGRAGQSQTFDGQMVNVENTIAEVHGDFRHRGLQLRALFAASTIGDAEVVSADFSDPPTDIVTIPDEQIGGYFEVAYDLAPLVGMPAQMGLIPWVRYEAVELQKSVPAGFPKNEALNGTFVTVGLEYKPIPDVVIKAELETQSNDANTSTADPFRIGAGFIF